MWENFWLSKEYINERFFENGSGHYAKDIVDFLDKMINIKQDEIYAETKMFKVGIASKYCDTEALHDRGRIIDELNVEQRKLHQIKELIEDDNITFEYYKREYDNIIANPKTYHIARNPKPMNHEIALCRKIFYFGFGLNGKQILELIEKWCSCVSCVRENMKHISSEHLKQLTTYLIYPFKFVEPFEKGEKYVYDTILSSKMHYRIIENALHIVEFDVMCGYYKQLDREYDWHTVGCFCDAYQTFRKNRTIDDINIVRQNVNKIFENVPWLRRKQFTRTIENHNVSFV